MCSATNNIENNNTYGLKQKDFISKLIETEKTGGYPGIHSIWIMVARSEKGNRLGWLVGFNHEADDSLYHLLNNKGDERTFKTIDSAVSFLINIHISSEISIHGANISWI